MSGERNLATLLRSMKPEMQEGVFVFCTLPEGKAIPENLKPLHIFHESEGTAFVVSREEAEAAGLPWQFASRLITLTVHSSLEAVGFLAAVTAPLAEAGISVNAVSAFYHVGWVERSDTHRDDCDIRWVLQELNPSNGHGLISTSVFLEPRRLR